MFRTGILSKILFFQLLFISVATNLSFAHEGNSALYELAIGQSATQADEEKEEKIDDLKDKIEELEKKIKKIQGQERSLQNEIDSLNDQISLIQLRIKQAETDIKQKGKELVDLESSIGEVSGKIDVLKDKVSYQYLIFTQRLRSRYKTGEITPFDYIFSNNINTLIQKVKYIESIEEEDNKIVERLKDTKQNYEWQKTTLEDKKTKVENLKAKIENDKIKLVAYRSDLDDQKSKKNTLLQQTLGDEARYQEQLKRAKAELDAIEGAVSSVSFASGTNVKKGEVIAVMGNSGYPTCSTGPHLHFEIRKDSKVVNSENYVKPTTLYVNHFSSGYTKIGSGKWSWPMKDPEITQRFGRTPWSWRYAGNQHTGVDMVADNTYIYAPEDGKLAKGSVSCYGTPMKYVAIDHGDGIISYYFHVK